MEKPTNVRMQALIETERLKGRKPTVHGCVAEHRDGSVSVYITSPKNLGAAMCQVLHRNLQRLGFVETTDEQKGEYIINTDCRNFEFVMSQYVWEAVCQDRIMRRR